MSNSSFFGAAPMDATDKRQSPIDIVIYLASMASDPRAIDPILDTVRNVTSRLRPNETPAPADLQQLARAYNQLEAYLVKDEPLRSYDKAGLDGKILQKFQLGGSVEAYWQQAEASANTSVELKPVATDRADRAHHSKTLGLQIIGGALILGAASFFLPAISSPELPWSNNFDMVFSLAADLVLFGGAWLFLRGLPGFKTGLRRSYIVLCCAMVLLALAQSQQVMYTYLGLWSNPFIAHGGVAIGFAVPVVLFYVAMLLFARLLHVRTFATSVIALLGICAAVGLLAAFGPLPPSVLSESVLRQVLPPSVVLDVVMIFACMMVLSIKKVASAAYAPALAWLFLALATVAITGIIYNIVQVALPTDNWVLGYGTISGLFLVSGIMLVKSAVAFNQIKDA
ncbi:MAG TPA: hypothetical protein VF466_05370 [Candidatus Saccharimonadales bacterium]